MENKQLLSPYAPVRYKGVNWYEFAREAAKHGYVTAKGQIASSLPEIIDGNLVTPLTQLMSDNMPETPDKGGLLGIWLAKAIEFRHWVPLVAQFELCGRQIFDIDDNLVEMLRNTNVDQCTLEGWNPPYDAFFMRFGKQESMRLPFEDDFEYLDGAFVGVTPWDNESSARRIRIAFTTVKKDGEGMSMPGYFVDLTPDEQRLPIHQAIEHFVARKRKNFEAEESDNESIKALRSHQRELLQESSELIKQAASLVINALFYLEEGANEGRKAVIEPGRDTPPSLVVEWAHTKVEKRSKLRSRLTGEGYAIVHSFGKELGGARGKSIGASKETHWRKGHWRQQPCGPKLSEVKRIWIKPTMINPADAPDEIAGHIYVVGSSTGSDMKH